MNEEKLLSLAKGSWQKEIVHDLIKYGKIYNPVSNLKGRASQYSKHYQNSFDNLLERIKNAGYKVTIQKGVKGGMYSALYKINTKEE